MPASVAATRIDSGIRSEPAGQQVSGDRTHVGVAGHQVRGHGHRGFGPGHHMRAPAALPAIVVGHALLI